MIQTWEKNILQEAPTHKKNKGSLHLGWTLDVEREEDWTLNSTNHNRSVRSSRGHQTGKFFAFCLTFPLCWKCQGHGQLARRVFDFEGIWECEFQFHYENFLTHHIFVSQSSSRLGWWGVEKIVACYWSPTFNLFSQNSNFPPASACFFLATDSHLVGDHHQQVSQHVIPIFRVFPLVKDHSPQAFSCHQTQISLRKPS